MSESRTSARRSVVCWGRWSQPAEDTTCSDMRTLLHYGTTTLIPLSRAAFDYTPTLAADLFSLNPSKTRYRWELRSLDLDDKFQNGPHNVGGSLTEMMFNLRIYVLALFSNS